MDFCVWIFCFGGDQVKDEEFGICLVSGFNMWNVSVWHEMGLNRRLDCVVDNAVFVDVVNYCGGKDMISKGPNSADVIMRGRTYTGGLGK